MTTNADVLKKVQKLLKLAKSSNPNEAANAAAMAQDLISRHKLESVAFDALDTITGEDIHWDQQNPLVTGGRQSSWKLRLAVFIAHVNECRVVTWGGEIQLVGRPSDTAMVTYLYNWLAREVDRLTKQYAHGMGRGYANSFRVGVVDTIGVRLKDQQKATEQQVMAEQTSEYALVRVKNAIVQRKEREIEVKRYVTDEIGGATREAKARTSDALGRMMGRQAGHSVRLTPECGRLSS